MHPKYHPSPGNQRRDPGTPRVQPQRRELWGPPSSCTCVVALGSASPKMGCSLGSPRSPTPPLGLPSSGSAWCYEFICNGGPGDPLAASGSPSSLDMGGAPSSPQFPCWGWAWMGGPGAVPILGQWNAAGAHCCLYPQMDLVWGIHVGLWGPECELGVLAGAGDGNGPCRELCVLAGDGVRAARPAGKALSTGRSGKHGHKSVSGRRRFITAPVRPGGPRGLRGRMRLPRASRSLGLARFPLPRSM